MIERLIRFFIEKSILNHILLVFIIVMAVFSYKKIPKEIFPSADLEAIVVSGGYVGSSPDILDKMVVFEIEDGLKTLREVGTIESTVRNGSFSIKAYLKDGMSTTTALDEVKDVIARIKRNLPSDMNEPIAKVMVHSYPLVTIAIATDDGDEALLKVANEVKDVLVKIPNLSDINIHGDRDYELLFRIDEKKIEAYDVNTQAVVTALASLSSIFPIGTIESRGEHVFVSTANGESDIEKLRDTTIVVGGKRLKVKDIAYAEFVLSDPLQLSHFNGKPNISIGINKAQAGNAIALVREIKEVLKKYQKKYPTYMFDTYTDTSIWIKNRLNTVISNILFGLILVSLAVYFFVNARISFVVTVGIPTSFMIGVISAQMMGYSLNMLSLLGALIALGMLVDEAIVVAENIYRHLEEGDDPKTAAILGASEMFPAVLTATATTIFAFLPLLIMSGEMGVFMRILPVMISVLLLSSLVEAFVFLPLHSYEVLHVVKNNERAERFWSWLYVHYKTLLMYLLERRYKTVAFFLVLTLVSVVMLGKNSKFQLFPDFDNTQIYVSGKVNINNRLEETQEYVKEIEKILLEKLSREHVASITSLTGFKLDATFKPQMAENNFHIFVNLHEKKAENVFNRYINPYLSPEYDDSDMLRTIDAEEIVKEIEKFTKTLSQNGNYEEFQVFTPKAGIVKSDIEISFSGDITKVQKHIDAIIAKMKTIEGVHNSSDDLIEGKKEYKLKINDYGASLGFNERYVGGILRSLFLKGELSKMFYKGELINVRSEEFNKDDIGRFKNIYIDIPGTFQKIKLSEVVNFNPQAGYSEIYKEDGVRISTIAGSLDKKILTSTEFLERMDDVLEEAKKDGIKIEIKGEQKENKQIQREMMQAAVIALFLIFIALVWMFNSIPLSILVLSSIPLSVLGVFVGNLVMGLNMTMPGLLGIVGLSGVVVNDGIIMVDFIKKARSEAEFLTFAVRRLRPILLTSITTILGLSTLIFFASGQALILQPMAVSLGFGLAWATVLNLLFIPTVYASIYKKRLNGAS